MAPLRARLCAVGRVPLFENHDNSRNARPFSRTNDHIRHVEFHDLGMEGAPARHTPPRSSRRRAPNGHTYSRVVRTPRSLVSTPRRTPPPASVPTRHATFPERAKRGMGGVTSAKPGRALSWGKRDMVSMDSTWTKLCTYTTVKKCSIVDAKIAISHKAVTLAIISYIIWNLIVSHGYMKQEQPSAVVNAYVDQAGYYAAAASLKNAPPAYCDNPDTDFDYGGGWVYENNQCDFDLRYGAFPMNTFRRPRLPILVLTKGLLPLPILVPQGTVITPDCLLVRIPHTHGRETDTSFFISQGSGTYSQKQNKQCSSRLTFKTSPLTRSPRAPRVCRLATTSCPAWTR